MSTRSRSFAAAGALVVALVAAPTDAAALQAARQTDDVLYVCIQDEAKIAVFDMTERRVVRVIDLTTLGFSATSKPHHIAVAPDGAHWYVSLIGADRVVKFDRSDRVVAHYAMETPGMLSLTPAGDRLLVSRSMSAVNPPARLAVIETATMQGDEVGVFFPRPHPVVVSAAGYAYTGSLGENQVASIALDGERVELVQVEGPQHSFVQFRISPDGRTLVGSTDRSGQLLAFDLSVPGRPRQIAAVEVGAMAFDPEFTPDGRFVWVPVKGTNDIAVVETAGWTVARRITSEAFRQPHQIVFSADGRSAFVSNNNKADHMADPAMAGHEMHAAPGTGGPAPLLVIDVEAGTVTQTLELGLNLTGMGTRAPR